MLRFVSRGQLLRHNSRDTTYVLQSRNSTYCVHREVRQITNFSSGSTKSCILGFRFKQHADRMCRVLNDYQLKGRVIDGTVQDGIMHIKEEERGRPVSKLDIHEYKLEDLEKRCLMEYFDFWLVHDIARILPDKNDGNAADDDTSPPIDERPISHSWRLDVYEYLTMEPPHRSYINHQFERLLRNTPH